MVGLIPDSEVERCKGSKPVLSDEERLQLVDAVKWVDEVLTGAAFAKLRPACWPFEHCRATN